MQGRGARSRKGLRAGALKSAIEAHATAPSPLAVNTELARAQVQFSTRGSEGLDEDMLETAILHLWDVGACWGAWPDWAEAHFPSMIRDGWFEKRGDDVLLTTAGMEAICAHAGRAIDAAPLRPCACVICAAAQLGRTIPMELHRGGAGP